MFGTTHCVFNGCMSCMYLCISIFECNSHAMLLLLTRSARFKRTCRDWPAQPSCVESTSIGAWEEPFCTDKRRCNCVRCLACQGSHTQVSCTVFVA